MEQEVAGRRVTSHEDVEANQNDGHSSATHIIYLDKRHLASDDTCKSNALQYL